MGESSKYFSRRLNRLEGYDYSRPGQYFVTVCIKDKECILGDVQNDIMIENKIGKIVRKVYSDIPNYYKNIKLDEFIIMPNHIHSIIIITKYIKNINENKKTHFGLLSKVIKSFKEATTRELKEKFSYTSLAWQRSFYDHIIRNEKSYFRIKKYIRENPENWEGDQYYI